jgi:hypothetical protein
MRVVEVIFDEMNVKNGIVLRRGRLVGCVNLSNVEREMEELRSKLEENPEKQPKKSNIAKKILALMVCGITTNVEEIVAYYPVQDLNHVELNERI